MFIPGGATASLRAPGGVVAAGGLARPAEPPGCVLGRADAGTSGSVQIPAGFVASPVRDLLRRGWRWCLSSAALVVHQTRLRNKP